MSGEGPRNLNSDFRRRTVNGYELLGVIGEGEFGKVIKAKNSKGLFFAIKMIPMSSIARNPKLQSSLSTETSILLKLNHPNIIEFVEEFQDEGDLCIVYEYCDKGNLRAYTQVAGALSERASVYIFREILSALAELERCGIVHRDLKPENILLKDTKVKLADFGLSSDMGTKHSSLVGSPLFMAPEAMKNFEYTIKGDIYSLGVTLFKTVTGNYPFYEEYYETLLNMKLEFKEESIPRDLSPQVRNLIWSCLAIDPNARPPVQELLAYIQNHFGELDGMAIEEDIRRKRGAARGTSANRGHSLAAATAHVKLAPWARAPHFAHNDSLQQDPSAKKALNISMQDYNSVKSPNYPASGRTTNTAFAPLNVVRDNSFLDKGQDRVQGRPYQPTHKPSNSLIPRDNPLLKPYEGFSNDQSYLGMQNSPPPQNPPQSQLTNIHVQLPGDDLRQMPPQDDGSNNSHMAQQNQHMQNVFTQNQQQQHQGQIQTNQPQLNAQLNYSVMNFELERVNTQERYVTNQPPQVLGPIIKRGYNPLLHQADSGNRRGSNPAQLLQRNYGSIAPQQLASPQTGYIGGQMEIQLQPPQSPNTNNKPLQIRGTPALGRQTFFQNFSSAKASPFKEYATLDDHSFQQRGYGSELTRMNNAYELKSPQTMEVIPNYGQNYGGPLQLQSNMQAQPQYFMPKAPQHVAYAPSGSPSNQMNPQLAVLERQAPMQGGSGSPYSGSFVSNPSPLMAGVQRLNIAPPNAYNPYQNQGQPVQQQGAPFGFATRDDGSTSSSKSYKQPMLGNYYSNQPNMYPVGSGPIWGG